MFVEQFCDTRLEQEVVSPTTKNFQRSFYKMKMILCKFGNLIFQHARKIENNPKFLEMFVIITY